MLLPPSCKTGKKYANRNSNDTTELNKSFKGMDLLFVCAGACTMCSRKICTEADGIHTHPLWNGLQTSDAYWILLQINRRCEDKLTDL